MLPEKLAIESGTETRESAVADASSGRSPGSAEVCPVARAEPVLRLVNPAQPSADAPPPIRLTVPAAAPPEEPADQLWCGAALRRVREARGLGLSQLADRTKVAPHHLENIEGDRYDRLPAYVYLRGILLSLAKELRLDAPKVCRSYLECAEQAVVGQR